MKKQGRGIATIMFGFGYGEGFPDHAIASAEIEEGGKILIRTAAADVGQGVLTIITQIAAEVLKVKPEAIRIIPGDTHLTKNSGSSSATRQTFFTGNAVKEASEGLLSNIYHYAS
ncbi:molybdopterin-dependent oxidoreductase, partial [bacterium]|nr:molybdopterin-dependent oxidoreductase [bacterium]